MVRQTIRVGVANRQRRRVATRTLARAVRAVLLAEGPPRAEVSVAVVDDPTIHDLNRRFLQHDYATDVLTFGLTSTPLELEGEIVVSADTAASNARQFDSDPATELTLYAIHGALHLVGYDDHTPRQAAAMRRRERHYLKQLRGPGSPGKAAAQRVRSPRRAATRRRSQT